MGTDLSFPSEKMVHSAMGLTVSRYEFVDYVSVPSATNFYSAGFIINPGNALMFPYLSVIARNYQSYRFKRLTFHYVAKAESGLDGSVTLATVNNPSFPVPANDRLMMEIQGAVSGPLWTNKHVNGNIRSNDLTGGLWKLIGYNSAYPGSSTYPSQDAGAFLLGIYSGAKVEKDIGAIYVDYEVELRQPVVSPLVSLTSPAAAVSLNQALPSDNDPIGRISFNGLIAAGGSYQNPWNDTTQTDELDYVSMTTSNAVFNGIFDCTSRQFARHSRASGGSQGYDMISAGRAANFAGGGEASQLIRFITYKTLSNANGSGIFPIVQVNFPGVLAFQLTTDTVYTTGVVSTNSFLQGLPVAKDFDNVVVQTGFLPGSDINMTPYAADNSGLITPLKNHFSVGFWVNIPQSASFPVTIRIPTSNFGFTFGFGSSCNFIATVEPYQLWGNLGTPAEVKETESKDVEDLIDKVVARLRVTDAPPNPDTPPTSPLSHVSGSGALSESGFTLLSDLLQRRRK